MVKQLSSLLGAAAMLLCVGCQNKQVIDGSAFPAEGTLRAPQRFADVQAAAGARNDATLTRAHFSGDALNSLGLAKLDAMIADDDLPQPMTVYLNLPDGALAETRQAAVRTYLRDAGLREEQIELRQGTNPDTAHLVSIQSARLYKVTETGLAGADPQSSESAPADEGMGVPTRR